MDIQYSKQLRSFKSRIGQTNHFLITIMVGLDAVGEQNIAIKEEFHTSWNPRSKQESAERSKNFAKQAALAWVIDHLDMYLRLCNKAPKLLSDDRVIAEFDGSNRSVYNKFCTIKSYCAVQDVTAAFVDLAICWRNRLVHFDADNDLLPKSKGDLLQNKQFIKEQYRNLDIERTLDAFYASKVPSFKEVTSMIRSLNDFVYEVDRDLLNRIDKEQFIKTIVKGFLSEGKADRAARFFNADEESKKRKVENILQQYSFDMNLPNPAVDQVVKSISKCTRLSDIN